MDRDLLAARPILTRLTLSRPDPHVYQSTDTETPFLDYRDMPQPAGRGDYSIDFSHLNVGGGMAVRFLYGLGPDEIGIIHALRKADGELSVLALPELYEPVMDGERMIGLRFPGSDRYPWQPWDPARDAEGIPA